MCNFADANLIIWLEESGGVPVILFTHNLWYNYGKYIK